MRPDQLEARLRERLDALGPAPRAELLHVLMLPDFERADRIGEFWGNPEPGAATAESLGELDLRGRGWPARVPSHARLDRPPLLVGIGVVTEIEEHGEDYPEPV